MWHVETDFFALAVFLIMFIKEFSNRRTLQPKNVTGIDESNTHRNAFYFVLIFSIISVIIDIVSSVAMNSITNWWVYEILMTIYVASMPLLAVVWVGYAYFLIHSEYPVRTLLKHFFLILIPYILYILLALSNPFTGLFFKLSPDIEYSRGILFMPVGVGMIMFYSLVGTLLVLFCWKKIASKYDSILLTSFFLLTAILTWVQLEHPGWLIINASYAIIYIWCDISIEDRRRQELYHEIQLKNTELETIAHKAASAAKAKSLFLSSMSHDIRTPMNAIVGFTKLMAHDKNDPAKINYYIHKIQTSSEYLLDLINNVLDMSKIESGEVTLSQESISLSTQLSRIESVIRPQIDEHNQQLYVYFYKIVHEYLIGDAVRLRQVLVNLLSNAIKYTSDGGKIVLGLRELDCDREGFARFEVKISDTGCGMTPEFAEHIFEPFTRAESSTTNKIQGTGLGMAITKNIIDLMGGNISVQSKLGEGSCFTVNLTLKIDNSIQNVFSFKNVLLVSDDEQLINNAKAGFESVNVNLYIAQSSSEADTILYENDIELVLLGGRLKNDYLINNIEEIREHSKDAILIFCCDYQDYSQVRSMIENSTVDGLIVRPFLLSNLIQEINKIKNKSQPETDDKLSALSGKKFLCAEDNLLNAEILSAILDMYGASCEIYPDGAKLVETFSSVKPGDFDAILMDVQMPVMNGLEATKAIRQGNNPLGKTIAIIAMTANAFSDDVQDCLDAGMDAHISKPLDINVLEHTLKALNNKI